MGSECEFATNIKNKTFNPEWHYHSGKVVELDDVLAEFDKYSAECLRQHKQQLQEIEDFLLGKLGKEDYLLMKKKLEGLEHG